MSTLADRLKELRTKKGLTQEQLARKAGVLLSSMNTYEKGRTLPGLIAARKLAKALGVRLSDLLDNVTDGTLRLMIGIIAAGILLLLFRCGIVPSLKIGDADFKGTALTWQMVLVIGFLGGFLERLVPDLLDKRSSQSNGGNGTRAAVTGAAVNG